MGLFQLVLCRLYKFLLIFRLIVSKWIGFQFLLFLQNLLVFAHLNATLESIDYWSEPSHLGCSVFEQVWRSSKSWIGSRFVLGCANNCSYSWRFAVLASLLMACITWWFIKSTNAGRAAHVHQVHSIRPPPQPDPLPVVWSLRERKRSDSSFGRVELRFIASAPPHRTPVQRLYRRITRWFGQLCLALRVYLVASFLPGVHFLQELARHSRLLHGLVLSSLVPGVPGASSSAVSCAYWSGWIFVGSWLLLKCCNSRHLLSRLGRIPMLTALWIVDLLTCWCRLPLQFVMVVQGGWFVLKLAQLDSPAVTGAGIICWDVLQSAGALFTVFWLGGSLWSSRESVLQLMDEFHPPLPPFRRCQTHRPSYFVRPHVGFHLHRHHDVVDDDDLLDELLASELQRLHLKQFHWFGGWSLHEELFRWWLICLSWLPRTLFQVLKLSVPVVGLAPLLWLQCNTALVADGWVLWSHLGDAPIDIDSWDSDLLVEQFIWLIVVGRWSLLAGFLMFLWWIWHLMSLLLAFPPYLTQPGLVHRAFTCVADKLFGDTQDESLERLVSDLDDLLGSPKPTPWDWTSLVLDLFSEGYSFLREDAFLLPPLPPILSVTADSGDSSALWGWLGSVRAALVREDARHHGLRHPRPGRGVGARRPRGRARPGAGAAGGPAEGTLRRARDRDGRGVHRPGRRRAG